MKINPFAKLRYPGVKGTVPAHFDQIKLFDRAGESVIIYFAELEPGVFDSGYDIILKDSTHLSKIPGTGSGWFKQMDHAKGFALHALKIAFSSRLSAEAVAAIDLEIRKFYNPSLDLI